MKSDPYRWFISIVAVVILAANYYALILYPYALDTDVKLWLTGLSGTAMLFLFGDQLARSAAKGQQAAFDKGMSSATPAPTDQPPPAS